jgi:hypothetical protein
MLSLTPIDRMNDHQSHVNTHSRILLWLPALLSLLLLVAFLFYNAGLHRLPWHDSWFFYAQFQRDPWYAVKFDTRPLVHLTWYIAYLISSTSFIGVNIILAVSLLLRGVLTYAIVRQLTKGNRIFCVTAALLSTAFPSEVGQLNDAYLNLHVGLNFYLASLFLLLRYYQSGEKHWQILSFLFLTASVFTYEAVQSLILISPILIWWLHRKFDRHFLRMILIWYLPTLLYLAYLFVLFAASGALDTREVRLVTTGLSSGGIEAILTANVWNLSRLFFTDWRFAFEVSPFHWNSDIFHRALLLTGLIVLLLWLIARQEREVEQATAHKLLQLLFIGLSFTIAGYFMFSVSSVRFEPWRTAFYSALGASIAITSFLELLSRSQFRIRLIAFSLLCILIVHLQLERQLGVVQVSILAAGGISLLLPSGLRRLVLISSVLLVAFTRQMDLQNWLVGISSAERNILSQVVRSAPALQPDARVIASK